MNIKLLKTKTNIWIIPTIHISIYSIKNIAPYTFNKCISCDIIWLLYGICFSFNKK